MRRAGRLHAPELAVLVGPPRRERSETGGGGPDGSAGGAGGSAPRGIEPPAIALRAPGARRRAH